VTQAVCQVGPVTCDAMISSPSWRGAIDIGRRYLDLTFAFTHIVARDRGQEFHLVLDTPDIPLALQRFVERDSAAIRTIQHELFASPIPVREMSYAFPPPTGVPRRTSTRSRPRCT
jgi:hypothetical protein